MKKKGGSEDPNRKSLKGDKVHMWLEKEALEGNQRPWFLLLLFLFCFNC